MGIVAFSIVRVDRKFPCRSRTMTSIMFVGNCGAGPAFQATAMSQPLGVDAIATRRALAGPKHGRSEMRKRSE
jgi:hypothetical protein